MTGSESLMALVGRIAARQWALVSVTQFRRLGCDDSWVNYRVDAGELIRVRRGVCRLPGAPRCWEQAVLAAALAAGDEAVVSHATAAAVWELKHSDHYTAGLHLTAPRQTRPRGVTSHQGWLKATERTVYRDIPVTTPERTIVDLSTTLGPQQLGECVDDALRRRLVRLDRLSQVVTSAAGRGRGPLAPLRAVLADRIDGYRPGDSDWELAKDRLWDLLGLPAAVRQHRVTAGGRAYRIDRAIPQLKIGVEWQGYDTHGTRSGFDRDSDRRADLTAEGWHMIDFTSRSSPDRIARAVLRAVEERSALTTPCNP